MRKRSTRVGIALVGALTALALMAGPAAAAAGDYEPWVTDFGVAATSEYEPWVTDFGRAPSGVTEPSSVTILGRPAAEGFNWGAALVGAVVASIVVSVAFGLALIATRNRRLERVAPGLGTVRAG